MLTITEQSWNALLTEKILHSSWKVKQMQNTHHAQRRLWVSRVSSRVPYLKNLLYTFILCLSNVHQWAVASVGKTKILHNAIPVAKQSRDTLIANWKWTEKPNFQPQNSTNFGSGYPSDPKCKTWVDRNCNIDAPFGFPDFVRFSWAPTKNALKEGADNCGPVVRWEADEDEEDDTGGKQSSLDSFMAVNSKGRKRGSLEDLKRKRQRLGVFNELGLSKVTKFVEVAY